MFQCLSVLQDRLGLHQEQICVIVSFCSQILHRAAAAGRCQRRTHRLEFALTGRGTGFTCGFTCGQGHVYERVVENLGPSSMETWGSGLGLVACSRCTCEDNLVFDGTWQGQGWNVLQRGKQLTRWDAYLLLHTNMQIFKYTHMCCVEWWGRKISQFFLSLKCTGTDRRQEIDGNAWLNCTPDARWSPRLWDTRGLGSIPHTEFRTWIRVFYWELIVGIPRTRGLLYSPWQSLGIPSATTPIGQLLGCVRAVPSPIQT